MAEQLMETTLRTALWYQFGAAIEMQEHAAQLSLFLGQHAIPDEALHWVGQAQEEPGN